MFQKIAMFLICTLVMVQSPSLRAQDSTLIEESISDITTVAFAGLGGAVLGLSTLSFVDEPKDHLKNILIGGAVGIIIGVGYVAWAQANKSSALYKNNAYLILPDKDFSTANRIAHDKNIRQKRWSEHTQNVDAVGYTFSF